MIGMDNTELVKELVGKRIQTARGEITREEFCDKLGKNSLAPKSFLNVETFKKWESGENRLPIDWIPAICDVLDCEVGYLFGEFSDKRRAETDLRKTTGLSDSAVKVLCDKRETPIGRIARLESLGFQPTQSDRDAAEEEEEQVKMAVEQDFFDERFQKYGKELDVPLSPSEVIELKKRKEHELSYIHSPEGYSREFKYSRDALNALMEAKSFKDFLRRLGHCIPEQMDDSLFLNPYEHEFGEEEDDIRDRRRLSVQFYAGKLAEEIMDGGQGNG